MFVCVLIKECKILNFFFLTDLKSEVHYNFSDFLELQPNSNSYKNVG